MLTREEKMKKIEALSQQVYELCDDVMESLEKEMNDAELIASVSYMVCGKLASEIADSLKLIEKEV